MPFCPPAMVATNVENMWTSSRCNVGKVQLMEALWLGCGAQGMKVNILCYNVENMWTSSRCNVGKVQLMEALWL